MRILLKFGKLKKFKEILGKIKKFKWNFMKNLLKFRKFKRIMKKTVWKNLLYNFMKLSIKVRNLGNKI